MWKSKDPKRTGDRPEIHYQVDERLEKPCNGRGASEDGRRDGLIPFLGGSDVEENFSFGIRGDQLVGESGAGKVGHGLTVAQKCIPLI